MKPPARLARAMPAPRPPLTDLDPFALPAETRGRFRMLLAAALVLTWGIAADLAPGLVLTGSDLEPDPRSRELASRFLDEGWASLSPADVEYVLEGSAVRWAVAILWRWLARVGVSALLVAAALAAAWLVYRTHARWRGLDRRVRPLPAELAPGPVAELRSLIERAGLPPRIALAYLPDRSLDGVAYGATGRETLVLRCPPDLLVPAWERALRPVAYHELGHVANGDIRRQEASLALWVVVCALLLGVTGRALYGAFAGEGPPGAAGDLGGGASFEAARPALAAAARNLLFAGVIWWIWAGIVRAREHYADWRVVSWGRRDDLLHRLRLPEPARRRGPIAQAIRRRLGRRPRLRRALGLLREYGWYHHPGRARRIAVLGDARPLFAVSPELALLTGLVLAVMLAHVELLYGDLVFLARSAGTFFFLLVGPLGMLALAAVGFVAMTALAYLVTGALGVQVQREAVAGLAAGPRRSWGYLRLGGTALLFAAGLEAGLLLTSASFLRAPVPVPFALAWLGGFACLTWMWLIHVHALSRLLLGSAVGADPPRWHQAVLEWASALLLAVLYSPALMARVTLHRAGDPETMAALAELFGEPAEAFAAVYILGLVALLGAALALYVVAGAVATAGAGIRLAGGRARCPRCGDPAIPRLAAGRSCPGCGSPLAPWISLRPLPVEAARRPA